MSTDCANLIREEMIDNAQDPKIENYGNVVVLDYSITMD